MPIGSDAKYVDAGINGSTHFGSDTDWIIYDLDPHRLQYCTWYKPYEWHHRCQVNGEPFPFKIPVPRDLFVADSNSVDTPNNAAAILLDDGVHLVELGPLCKDNNDSTIFGHPSPGQNVSSGTFQSIYEDGYYGAHFGSGLSSIGGTIRLSELLPESEPIRHALKWEMWGKMYYYLPKEQSECYRWPAVVCDGAWKTTYGGVVSATRPGSLLAIPPSLFDQLNSTLKTIPGRKMLQALTDYGAYIVSDSAWDQQQFCVEQGVAQEFFDYYGFSIGEPSPFADDMIYVSKFFHVVDNNSKDTIGGGGKPRKPLLPPIGN